ncbi:titin isoform X2 [Nasonia vitripennis]|uniref:C3H1-type domain-containing protein n=2 Tax=Nasonia vitripennis TaxID=7425 RepID=A0A7M7Q682_NASVI|nr:titin isoform X2 [Nasonia vitripennis]
MLCILPGERGMASDLSSGCTEVNDILDDEKEEGEISLEDVSSSEEGPTCKYLPRAFGQCRYCLSTHQCATWCSSLTVNKINMKRGLQGKENRSNQRYHKDGLEVPILGNSSSSKSIPYSSSTLQEKNDDDPLGPIINSDLIPISSDSDMEVVGLTSEKHEKKSSRRRKLRKKRRKKSPDTLSLSLSPNSQDFELFFKDSTHRIERDKLESGHTKYRHHHSPNRRKLASRLSPPSRRRNRSPLANRSDRRRTRSPLKTSPSRSRKTVQKKSRTLENGSPVKQSFNKLLKKVRHLETCSRSREKGSSLQDKLNNMIKQDKKESSAPVEKSKEPSHVPTLSEEPKPAVKDKAEEKEDITKKPIVVEEKNNNDNNNKEEDEEDLVILRQIALETKVKKSVALIKPEDIKTEPVDEPSAPAPPPPQEPPPPLPSPKLSEPAQPEQPQQPQQSQEKAEDKAEHKLPNFCMDDNDEDLELRMIALHSAVLKKHRTRIARGRRKRLEATVPRIESPFTSSFLEDFPMLAEICSPTSPLGSKRDILLAEDMELDSDMELETLSEPEDHSPYSPSDDITGDMLLDHDIVQPVPVPPVAVQPIGKNRSLYSPSNPTETPASAIQQTTKQPEVSSLDGSILEFTSQESRPYSPSDATVYDPDLPGVHSPVKSTTLTTTTPTGLASMPLQPPPMPPLSMFGPQQPMLLGCPPSMLNAFGDPIAMVPSSMVASFPALHQSVNPLLLPAAPPLFAYPTAHPAAVSIPAPQPQAQPQQPPIPSKPESNELDDFMETDLDGSPLVPIEKDGNDQRWQLLGEPLYLQNVPELTQSEHSKLPTLMERSLVPAAVLRCNKQLQKQPPKRPMPPVGEALFRNADMRPVALVEETDVRAASFKPIKLQAQPKKSVIAQPAAAFNSTLDDIVEKEEKPSKSTKEVEEKKEESRTSSRKKEAIETTYSKCKSKKPVSKHKSKELDSSRQSMREMLNERRKDLSRRVRERSCRLSRARSVSKNISKTKKIEETTTKEISKSDDKKRRSSVEDDEQALRESLLASLAMKAKEPQPAAVPKPPSPEKSPATRKPSAESVPKSTDEMPLAERVSAFLAKSKEKDLKNGTAPVSATVSKATGTNQLKRVSEPLSEASLPPRKIIKRVASMTPASKVVNNAKRYQNLMLQRKLTQQTGSPAIKSRFKLNHTSHARSVSPVVTKSSNEIHRIIINLNEDTESESETEEARSNVSPVKVRPTLNIPTTDFEKSVDQFLKNARQQQEMASTVNKNVVSAKPMKNNPLPMGPPPISTPSASQAVTDNTNITTAKITVATPPVDGSIGSIVSTTADSVSIAKNKVVTPKVTKTTSKLPSNATATPTAVKHLTLAQQEEYRLLKQIIQEREKTKESTSTTSQSQPTLEKITTAPSSSPLSASSSPPSLLPTCTSSALYSSTPKAVAKVALSPTTSIASSLPVKPHEQVLGQNESVPKKQSVATISPISKPSVESIKVPLASSKPLKIGVPSTKIIHVSPSISQSNTLNKTAAVITTTSTSKASAVAGTESTATTLKLTPQSNNNMLLGMISDSINRQRQQISDAAQKVSTLTILTKEQINLKTSQIQQTKLNSEGNVVMDDLNKIGNNLSITSKRFTGETNKAQSTKNIENVNTKSALKNDPRKDCSSADTSQDKTKQNWENFKEVVNDEVQALSHLPAQQQKELLSKTEESLIEKRRSVVDDIAEMSLKLREWEIERDLQYKYNEEAKKLREELRKVEGKIQQQKDKLNTIQPQVSLYHKKINSGRKECFKLSKICDSLGQKIIGSNYNVPTAGAEILNNRIKEVVKHTQKLQNKKTQYTDTVQNNFGKSGNTSGKKNFKPNNNLSKRKEIVKQPSLNNNKIGVLSSNSTNINSASKNEPSSTVSNNINTCTNEKIIINPKIKNDPIDTSTENSNANTKCTVANNNPFTSTERTNLVLHLNDTSNLETITNSNISNIILTADSIVNLKTENVSVNLNSDNEIKKLNQTFNDKIDKRLRDNENIILCSESTDNAGSLTKNNFIKANLTMYSSKSESITNVNSPNDFDNPRSIIQRGVENSASNAASSENENLPTGINVIQTISNVENTENQTLQTVSIKNNIIKTETEETAPESIEVPTTVEENRSVETYNPNLSTSNAPSEKLNNETAIQKMALDSDNATNDSDTRISFSTNNVDNNINIDDDELMETNNKIDEIKIKLEVEDHTSNASEIHNNIDNSLSSMSLIHVPKIEESVLPRKKSRHFKSAIKRKPTKAQQRKMYNKQKQQLKVAENFAKGSEDSKKKSIQPYESVLKPLRAPRNNTNGFLCPFEMQGTCNDGDCKYIHSSLR